MTSRVITPPLQSSLHCAHSPMNQTCGLGVGDGVVGRMVGVNVVGVIVVGTNVVGEKVGGQMPAPTTDPMTKHHIEPEASAHGLSPGCQTGSEVGLVTSTSKLVISWPASVFSKHKSSKHTASPVSSNGT